MSQQRKNIKIALVIGHINAGNLGLNIFMSLRRDLDAARPENQFGPRNSGIEMYLSPVLVKKGEHNAPNTEKDGMDAIKGMQP
jgi:hypothetical protein